MEVKKRVDLDASKLRAKNKIIFLAEKDAWVKMLFMELRRYDNQQQDHAARENFKLWLMKIN